MAYFPFKTADDAHKVTIDTSNGIVNGAYTTTEALYFSSYRGSGTGYWIGYEYPWGERHTITACSRMASSCRPARSLLPSARTTALGSWCSIVLPTLRFPN